MKVRLVFVLCYLCTAKAEDDIESNDFSEVKAFKFFVDKTMMIKDFVKDSSPFSVITAPAKFGKSTIIDMIRRFLAIPVDNFGKRIPLNTADCFKLFCQPKLKICEDETFVREHMGQHPVIHIHYYNFFHVYNMEALLEELQQVVLRTFRQHRYLSKNTVLFPTEAARDTYIRYYDYRFVINLSEREVERAFTYLSDLLYQHFDRKVIVLFDGYDVLSGHVLGGLYGEDEIVQYLKRIKESLLKENGRIEKVLMTGVLRVDTGPPVKFYRWLGDHQFSKYYGLTEQEVEQIIKRYRADAAIQQTLANNYKGYRIQNQLTEIYSLWSVINFIVEKMEINCYWDIVSRFGDFSDHIINNEKVMSDIKRLVLKEGTVAALVSSPLNARVIKNINQYINTKKQDADNERLYLFFFDLGFLSTRDKYPQDNFMNLLEIPTYEMYAAFSRLLARRYMIKYQYDIYVLLNTGQVISDIKPNRSNSEMYSPFFELIRCVLSRSDQLMTESDVRNILFLFLVSKCPGRFKRSIRVRKRNGLISLHTKHIPESLANVTKVVVEKSKDRFKSDVLGEGRIELAAGLKQNVGIIIEIKYVKKKRENVQNKLDVLAKENLCQALLTYDLKRNRLNLYKSIVRPKGVIYIGLAYDLFSGYATAAFHDPTFDKEPTFLNTSVPYSF